MLSCLIFVAAFFPHGILFHFTVEAIEAYEEYSQVCMAAKLLNLPFNLNFPCVYTFYYYKESRANCEVASFLLLGTFFILFLRLWKQLFKYLFFCEVAFNSSFKTNLNIGNSQGEYIAFPESYHLYSLLILWSIIDQGFSLK